MRFTAIIPRTLHFFGWGLTFLNSKPQLAGLGGSNERHLSNYRARGDSVNKHPGSGYEFFLGVGRGSNHIFLQGWIVKDLVGYQFISLSSHSEPNSLTTATRNANSTWNRTFLSSACVSIFASSHAAPLLIISCPTLSRFHWSDFLPILLLYYYYYDYYF